MKTPVLMGQVRAESAAGTEALNLASSAEALHRRGGRLILPPELQDQARSMLNKGAKSILDRLGIEDIVVPQRKKGGAAAKQGAKAAGKNVAKGVGRAAGTGALIDGGLAAVQAGQAYLEGKMSGSEAAAHVAKETASGGLSAACGTALLAGVVAVTGPISAPAAAAVSIAGTLVSKKQLRRLFDW